MTTLADSPLQPLSTSISSDSTPTSPPEPCRSTVDSSPLSPAPISDSPIRPVSDSILKRNRGNAQRSTGPRTPEGKARSSQNALTHGQRARLNPATLVPNTQREDYQHFLHHLQQSLNPANPLEDLLVERIALLAWKLRTNAQAQAHLLDLANHRERERIEAHNRQAQAKYDEALAWNKRYRVKEMPPPPDLQPLPDEKPAAQCLTQHAESGASALSALQRYETATEKAFYHALNQYRLLHGDGTQQQHHHFHYHHESPPISTEAHAPNPEPQTLNPEPSDSSFCLHPSSFRHPSPLCQITERTQKSVPNPPSFTPNDQ